MPVQTLFSPLLVFEDDVTLDSIRQARICHALSIAEAAFQVWNQRWSSMVLQVNRVQEPPDEGLMTEMSYRQVRVEVTWAAAPLILMQQSRKSTCQAVERSTTWPRPGKESKPMIPEIAVGQTIILHSRTKPCFADREIVKQLPKVLVRASAIQARSRRRLRPGGDGGTSATLFSRIAIL